MVPFRPKERERERERGRRHARISLIRLGRVEPI